jgi:hypothetical protein
MQLPGFALADAISIARNQHLRKLILNEADMHVNGETIIVAVRYHPRPRSLDLTPG